MIGHIIRELITLARRGVAWLQGHVVSEVSEHSAVCEFDCSKVECRQSHWDHCTRRLASVTGPEAGSSNQ